jgi:hypothetical protein
MIRARLLVASFGFVLPSCGDGTGSTTLEDTFTLVAENDVPLPSDHGEPDGCCLTLSGSVTLPPVRMTSVRRIRTRTTASSSTTPSRGHTPGRATR